MGKRVGILVLMVIVFLVGFIVRGTTRVSGQNGEIGSAWAAVPSEKGGSDQLGPYEVVPGWPKPLSTLPNHEKWGYGAVQYVFAQNPNRIFILERGELPDLPRPASVPIPQIGPGLSFPISQYPIRNASQGPASSLPGDFGSGGPNPVPYERNPHYVLAPDNPVYPGWKGRIGIDARWEHVIVVVDANGNILPETETWKKYDHLFGFPHFIGINPYDPEKHIWTVDAARHVIYKFTNDGSRLVQTIGQPNNPGHGPDQFNSPTFLAWLPDGTMLVADGYVNTRIVKFDKDGKYLMEWGQHGTPPHETRPGYFNLVHGLAVDPVTRHVFVVDRTNKRIQVFDENGKFLDMWNTGAGTIYSIYYSDGKVWGADADTHRLIAWNTQGYLQYAFGGGGLWPGNTDGIHGVSVDQDGTLYTSDVFVGRATKYRPRRGANPNYLVGQPVYSAWKD